jgi:hypothetical protein
MASILDNLRDNRGIRILDTQLNSSSAMAGAYDILYHTNGYIYVAFARNNLDYPAVEDRQIWMARSADGGTTFETPVKISDADGKWHDNPAIIQIDTTSTSSSIGLVFSKAIEWQDRLTSANERSYPYRALVSVTLALESSIDILTNATYQTSGLTLVRGTNSFQVYGLNSTLDQVKIYENPIVIGNTADGFINNAWAIRYISNFAGTGKSLRSIKVRPTSSGHLALVGAVETVVTDELPLCNLGLSFSADDGNTWSTIQYMTNFTGTPAIDLVGLTGVVETDLTEVAPNQFAILYQEGTPSQVLTTTSTPVLLATSVSDVVYHSGKDALFISGYDSGIYVYDCASQTFIFHFTTSSTPPIWNDRPMSIAISPDGNYLAAGMLVDGLTLGGLDVWDISDATPANWTVVASLRSTSTPAIRGTGVGWVQFSDNTHVVYTNLSGDTNSNLGGVLDVVGLTITYLTAPATGIRDGSYRGNYFLDIANDALYAAHLGYVWRNKVSDGTVDYYYYAGSSIAWTWLANDPINSELIIPNNLSVYRFENTGSAINLLEIISNTSNPRVPENITGNGSNSIGTGGLFIGSDQCGNIWYDFHSRKVTGAFTDRNNVDTLGYDPAVLYNSFTKLLKSNEWLCTFGGDADTIHFQKISQTGKLRWGIFNYTPATKLVDDTSDDFHLLCDTDWISANDALHLVKPRISAAPQGNVVLTALRYYPQVSGINLVTGVMNREHLSLGIRAAIAKRITNNVTSRARIRLNPTKTVDIKARMVFAQCIKIMAYIMPKQVQTTQLRASILNFKSTSFTGIFNVNFPGKQRKLRLQFTANTGYTGLQTYTIKARIIKNNRKRFTGHFLISGNPTTGNITFETTVVSYSHKMGMKAFLVSNR